jgi:hypothetical protein
MNDRSRAHARTADAATGTTSVHQLTKYLQRVPSGDRPTAYDAKLMSIYQLLLEAESEGAETIDMTIFFEEPGFQREQWQLVNVVESHLERAHTLRDCGYLIEW